MFEIIKIIYCRNYIYLKDYKRQIDTFIYKFKNVFYNLLIKV